MGWQDKIAPPSASGGTGVIIQYGALCWRMGEAGVEVLLITSRDSGRWLIPKGWPMRGLAPEAAAAQEAWEEAGVEGVLNPVSLGRYGYHKALSPESKVPCAVAVYGLRVVRVAEQFPEVTQRRRQWFPPEVAADLVQEPELARIILDFVPPQEGRPAPIAGE